ncbi:MAG: aminoacyl-tRNA hydrolase [Gammaproteobacteria bacterium]
MSSTTSLKLIVGLGNPGAKYQETRHNAGFWFIDRLAADEHCAFSRQAKFHGEVSRIQSGRIDCRLLKPDTFMNHSGRAVSAFLDYYSITPEQVLVAHDEIDLEPGIARLKRGGGHGGHNGLRDIISAIGSKDFYRLRIGVGHPGHKDDVIDYVLKRAGGSEQKAIESAVEDALAVMPYVFGGEMEKAMTQLHSKSQVTSHKSQGGDH